VDSSWPDLAVDRRAFYEAVARRLTGLLARLDDRLSPRDQSVITEYIDHNELGLALESMTDALADSRQGVSAEERSDLLTLALRMKTGEKVEAAIAALPET
jgi:hypothetical protein